MYFEHLIRENICNFISAELSNAQLLSKNKLNGNNITLESELKEGIKEHEQKEKAAKESESQTFLSLMALTKKGVLTDAFFRSI